jgi:hypothetical protein
MFGQTPYEYIRNQHVPRAIAAMRWELYGESGPTRRAVHSGGAADRGCDLGSDGIAAA